MPDGGHWGPSYAVEPDPSALVRACQGRTIATRDVAVGWAFFEIAPKEPSTSVRFALGSDLPTSLIACITADLSTLRVASQGLELPPSLAYVSLR